MSIDRKLAAALVAAALLTVSAPPVRAQALYDAFVRAVVEDQRAEVHSLLGRGMDPNTVDPNGEPMLAIAARSGWMETLDALLAAGAKVDGQNGVGDTALMVAALQGQLPIVKRLLSANATINRSGWTPLIYASTNAHNEVVRTLLDAGADIDAASPNGTTALMMAARGGHAETVALLLERGADPNRRNDSGATALSWARRGGFLPVEQALLRRGARG